MPRVSITIPDKNPQPYRFNLDHKKVTIGRSKDSDIVIDEPSASGLHATMERVEGGYILRDRGSTNGITLDDKLMEIIDLRNGDDVKVGDSTFDYHLTEDELDVLDDEEFTSHEKIKEEENDDSSSQEEDDEDEEEKIVKKKSPPKKKPTPQRKASPVLPQAAAAAAAAPVGGGGGGFFTSLAAFILGTLFFFMGVNRSYVQAEEEKGREEVSLLKDMKEGKPASAPKKVVDTDGAE